jgi:hypothetical protein
MLQGNRYSKVHHRPSPGTGKAGFITDLLSSLLRVSQGEEGNLFVVL